MISGGNFRPDVTVGLAVQLSHRRNYRLFSLGIPGFSESGVPKGCEVLFEEAFAFPGRAARPRTIDEWISLPYRLAVVRNTPPLLEGEPKTVTQRLAGRLTWHKSSAELPRILQGYDLYHWHGAFSDRLSPIRFLPAGARLILSFWGSDLYRTWGPEQVRRQQEACEAASLITMASGEMRELFLLKFGQNFRDRVRLATYGTDVLETLDRVGRDRAAFCERHSLPPDSIVICAASNGSRFNQHIAMLHAIAGLDRSLLEKVAVIVPMTYGGLDRAYFEEIRSAAAASCPVPVRFLTEFLTEDELAALRTNTDVLIHLPFSDQLGAAMCETLYAGGWLITGAWLPYSRLRVNGARYQEIEDVSALPRALLASILNLDQIKK